MSGSPVRTYWDACVVIAYLSADQNRIHTLDAILDEVRTSGGTRKIVTSEISKVEVAFVVSEKKTRTLDPQAESAIEEFWKDDSVIELVEFSGIIATIARRLIRESVAGAGKIIKPMDAIHLATATYAQVAELHTYNVADFQGQPLKVCEPYVVQGTLALPLPPSS